MAQSLTDTVSPQGMASNVRKYTLAWTSASDGSVALTTGEKVWGTICRVVINPGATAPTDNYDVTLTDESGVDILAGQGTDLDTTNTSSFVPLLEGTDGTTTAMMPIMVNDRLTLTIANAGDSKVGEIVLYAR
jgi:hypothetical protein